eukprot:gene40259-29815_t
MPKLIVTEVLVAEHRAAEEAGRRVREEEQLQQRRQVDDAPMATEEEEKGDTVVVLTRLSGSDTWGLGFNSVLRLCKVDDGSAAAASPDIGDCITAMTEGSDCVKLHFRDNPMPVQPRDGSLRESLREVTAVLIRHPGEVDPLWGLRLDDRTMVLRDCAAAARSTALKRCVGMALRAIDTFPVLDVCDVSDVMGRCTRNSAELLFRPAAGAPDGPSREKLRPGSPPWWGGVDYYIQIGDCVSGPPRTGDGMGRPCCFARLLFTPRDRPERREPPPPWRKVREGPQPEQLRSGIPLSRTVWGGFDAPSRRQRRKTRASDERLAQFEDWGHRLYAVNVHADAYTAVLAAVALQPAALEGPSTGLLAASRSALTSFDADVTAGDRLRNGRPGLRKRCRWHSVADLCCGGGAAALNEFDQFNITNCCCDACAACNNFVPLNTEYRVAASPQLAKAPKDRKEAGGRSG